MPGVRSGNRDEQNRARRTSAAAHPPASTARLLIVLGAVASALALGYVVWKERSEDASSKEIASSAQTSAVHDASGTKEKDGRQTSRGPGHGWASGSTIKDPPKSSRDLPGRQRAADAATENVEKLIRARSDDGLLSPERANQIRQKVEELAQQGAEGSAAIEDLRRKLENGELDAAGAGPEDVSSTSTGADFRSAAEAAPEEVRPLLERLAGTTDPMEIAMLAQDLEEEAPGVYRQEVLDAARQALRRAAQDPPEKRVDVTPVFEVFEAFGSDGTAKDLEQDTAWWPYSLMALAGMPDGRGVPGLIATASDPRFPVEQRPQLAFQMLAQASAAYPEAGEALVDLARADQIPERAWGSIGAALQGMHLQFPQQIFGGSGSQEGLPPGEAPRIGGFQSENLDVHYDLRRVSSTWSQDQIDRQIDLIDELIDASGSSDAKRVLADARSSLLAGQ